MHISNRTKKGSSADSDDWWKIKSTERNKPQKLKACAIGENGDTIVAVGENEEVWIWRK